MKKKDAWFIEERAFAFASLVLTKANDVAVRPYGGRDIAIDLLVEVLKDGKSTTRFFGAQIVAYMDLPVVHNGEEKAHSHSRSDPFEASLPICKFVIGVRKPHGLYRWVVEPIVEDGKALLRSDAAVSWQTLDGEAIDRMICQVNAYYDAHSRGSMARTRDRHLKAGS